MLEDGQVVDSAMLPSSAVQGHPVTVSAESLLQSVTQSFTGSQGTPAVYGFGQSEAERAPGTQFHRINLTSGASPLTQTAGAIPG